MMRNTCRWVAVVAFATLAACGDGAETDDDGSTRQAGATSTATGTGGSSGTGAGGGDVLVPVEGGICAMVNPSPAGVPDGAPLDDAATGATLEAITSFLATRERAEDWQADASIVHAFARTAPNVFDTGVGPDCAVWMRLTDGTSVSIFKDRAGFADGDPEPPDVPPAPRPQPTPLEVKDFPFTEYALPKSSKAFVGMSDGLSKFAIDRVEAALTMRGYGVTRAKSVRLADLRQVKDMGVMWLSGHGATCGNKVLGNKINYCISTDDEIAPGPGTCLATDCAAANADRLAGRVGFMINDRGALPPRVSYGINASFVDTYWTFSENSLVFLDACLSMSPVIVDAVNGVHGNYAGELRDAVKKKGAGTLVGWDGVASAGWASNTVNFFFDRVLGANKFSPIMPGQRPFSAREVYAAMIQKNRTVDPAPLAYGTLPANLVLEQVTPADTILAPSIRNLVIGDPDASPTISELASDTKLSIYGEMGTRDVSVTVSLAPMAVTTPRSDKAVVTLPGASTKGEVEVAVLTQGRLIKSNRVPLTSWKGPCKFKATLDGTFGAPGVVTTLDCAPAHFRGDIHAFRMKPEEMPLPGRAVGMGAFEAKIDLRSTVSDTVCKASGSGQGTLAGIQTAIVDETTGIPWMPMHLPNPGSPNPWYALSAVIDTANPQLMMLRFKETHKIYPAANITISPMQPPTHQDDFPLSPSPVDYQMQAIPLDAAYVIKQMPMTFSSVLGNDGEIDCNLTPDAGTAPTMTTEG